MPTVTPGNAQPAPAPVIFTTIAVSIVTAGACQAFLPLLHWTRTDTRAGRAGTQKTETSWT